MNRLTENRASLPADGSGLHTCMHGFSREELTELEKNFIKKLLDDYFSCAICLSVMHKPAILRCGHTFCKDCIGNCFTNSHYQCPICRKYAFGLSDITTSQHIEEMINGLTSKIMQKSGVPVVKSSSTNNLIKLITVNEPNRPIRNQNDPTSRRPAPQQSQNARRTISNRPPWRF
ncbi:E3 ubiquitin-protein ligase TRIM56-like [Adelges cooleyi]|uniref:E3 ubiquitin-protein ligase TRIM56-like n=1 Tax=Adelges cooleyi TaxID=133065 RepID=UPI00217F4BBC|nr:E3 ubiquitin-protein ligase TRIM56-like [Adelges cooleyi]